MCSLAAFPGRCQNAEIAPEFPAFWPAGQNPPAGLYAMLSEETARREGQLEAERSAE